MEMRKQSIFSMDDAACTVDKHKVKVKVVHNVGLMSLHSGKSKLSSINFTINEESNTVDINHCYTTKKHRGKGFAAILLKEMIKYCEEKKLEIVPICSYAKETIPKLG